MNIIAENPIVLSYKKRLIRYPEEDEAERWDGVALDFYLRTGTVPDEVLHYKALAHAGLRSLKYRDDQPRVPAGNPDGGQWTAEGGSGGENEGGGSGDAEGRARDDSRNKLAQLYERGYLLSERMTPNGRLCRYLFSFGILEGPGPNTFSCDPRPLSSAVSHYRLLPLNDNIIRKAAFYDYAR